MDPPGSPHEALFFVLAYLPLHELLLMTQVCKSLKQTISNDILIWLHLVVETPLNRRLTDNILLRFASKARGRLRTLALLNCFNITDDGLFAVLNANPLLTKLYVPGCTSLTPEGLIKSVKTLTMTTLKINGIYNLHQEHLQTLQSNLPKTSPITKPRFYHKYISSSFRSLDEEVDRALDVEMCPKCKQIKLVFECANRNHTMLRGQVTEFRCRGCCHCIPWCEGCGRCVMDQEEQGETICNDTLCLDCWFSLPKCNLCNKPFCSRHAVLLNYSQSCEGFVCDICHAESLLG